MWLLIEPIVVELLWIFLLFQNIFWRTHTHRECSMLTEWLLFYQKCSFCHEFWSRSQNEVVINHQAIFLKHMLNESKNACSATIFNSKNILNAGETNLQMIRLMHRQTDTQMNRWMKNLCVNRLFSWIRWHCLGDSFLFMVDHKNFTKFHSSQVVEVCAVCSRFQIQIPKFFNS